MGEVKNTAPPKAKVLPDIFNQIIEEKLNADGIGEGFDEFTGAEIKNDDGGDVDALDLPMDVFLNAAGSANKEYDEKIAQRLREKEESESEKRKREQLEIMEKLKNKPPDPFIDLFGPQIQKKEEVEEDDWGDFDAQNENVQNAEDDFFDAPFDDNDDAQNDKMKKTENVIVDEAEDEIDWNGFGGAEVVENDNSNKEKQKKEKKEDKKVEIVKTEELDIDFGGFGDDSNTPKTKKDKKKSKEERKKERRERKRLKKEKKKKEKEKEQKKKIESTEHNDLDLSFNGFDDSMTKSVENNVFDEIKPKTPTSIKKTVETEDAIDFDGFDGWNQSEDDAKDKNVKKEKKQTLKEPKKQKSISLKIEDEDDWDLRYEQNQKQQKKEVVIEENSVNDDDEWGDFDNFEANDAEQNKLDDSDWDKKENENEADEADDDWGDFGEEQGIDSIGTMKSEQSVSKEIVPSFPLDDIEEQSYDNLNVPEKEWKRTKSLSIQNEESLSDLKHFGPDIRANHESLDLLDDDDEDEDAANDKTQQNELSLSKTFEIEETEIKKEEINPFE